jgi:hypothetical protein
MAMDVEKTMEFILEQTAHIAVLQARNEAEIAHTNLILRRAVKLAVQEARAERRKRREADERLDVKMDQLASSQLLTEEKLRLLGEKIDRYVDERRRPGGNGHPQ